MKRIFNGNARALAMDMSDVHHIAIYGDLIAAKVQGRAASGGLSRHGSCVDQYQKKKLNFYLRSSHLLTAIQFHAVSAKIICIIQCGNIPFSEHSNVAFSIFEIVF